MAVMAMLQREITFDDDLLDLDGGLRHRGWARGARLRYEPARVRAARQRIKEWEHYTVLTSELSISLTLAQLGIVGAAHVEVLRLSDGHVASGLDLFVPRRDGLPVTPYLDAPFEKRTRHVCFSSAAESRAVSFAFANGTRLRGVLELGAPGPGDGLAVATPFEAPELFFYEYKVPDLLPAGWLELDGHRYELASGRTHAILDWGRGAWPKQTRWLWGWGAGAVAQKRVSFNLGCGFGDMSAASENAVVVDGVLHKLGDVSWHYDPQQRSRAWTFEDDAGRLSLTFIPQRHREWGTNLVIWGAQLDKVYGHYSGTVVLDDGSRMTLDGVAGFAEEMTQRW